MSDFLPTVMLFVLAIVLGSCVIVLLSRWGDEDRDD